MGVSVVSRSFAGVSGCMGGCLGLSLGLKCGWLGVSTFIWESRVDGWVSRSFSGNDGWMGGCLGLWE